MYVCVYIYIYIYIYIYTHTHTHTYIYIYIATFKIQSIKYLPFKNKKLYTAVVMPILLMHKFPFLQTLS